MSRHRWHGPTVVLPCGMCLWAGGASRGSTVAAPHAGLHSSIGRSLDFDSEVVRIFIRGDSVEVEGYYRFLCRPSPASIFPILYPYPTDSLMGGARMVSLEGRIPSRPWQAIEFAELSPVVGAVWQLPAGWGDTLEVQAVYRQGLRGRHARYIVTTTRGWDHPLRTAGFEIHLQEGARPLRFSYPFTKSTARGQSYYGYKAVDFMPDRDIVVDWTE